MSLEWGADLQLMPLGQLPIPRGFRRTRAYPGPQRCQSYDGFARTRAREQGLSLVGDEWDDQAMTQWFMDKHGSGGRSAGCPWHQMDAPHAVLDACDRIFQRARGKAFDAFTVVRLEETQHLSVSDRLAVKEFTLNPFQVWQDSAGLYLGDGSHRLCALRAEAPAQSKVLVKVVLL